MVSLGCAKNLVDSERLLGCLTGLGLVVTDDPKAADLLMVNTCAFIEPAVKESIETILELSQGKKKGAKLAVVGCLPSRDLAALVSDLPEADLLATRADYPRLPQLLANLMNLKAKPLGPFETWSRQLSTPPWRAYLKVAEGCDHRCAYCLIPSLRGPLATRSLAELTREAAELVAGGVVELTLVAQDLTAWCHDGQDLGDLVSALAAINGLKWARLMYAYPERLTEKLVRRLAQIPRVPPYLDLPIQHASPRILKRMGRPASDPLALVKRLREWWPGVALRTTLMVGFPGEDESDFEKMVALVEEARFDHLGVFAFEPEEPAPAARFPHQVPRMVAKKRRIELLKRQRKISLANNRARVEAEYDVLVEGPAEDSPLIMTGRAYFQAPEVDGLIYFDGVQPLGGQVVRAKVTRAQAYDLAAGLVDESARVGRE
jgi:ribosomal protein S12 methylthiotransferase RimO